MFVGKTCFFTSSVPNSIKSLWKDKKGIEESKESAMFLFSSNSTDKETIELHKNDQVVYSALFIIQSSNKEKLLPIGCFILPPSYFTLPNNSIISNNNNINDENTDNFDNNKSQLIGNKRKRNVLLDNNTSELSNDSTNIISRSPSPKRQRIMIEDVIIPGSTSDNLNDYDYNNTSNDATSTIQNNNTSNNNEVIIYGMYKNDIITADNELFDDNLGFKDFSIKNENDSLIRIPK